MLLRALAGLLRLLVIPSCSFVCPSFSRTNAASRVASNTSTRSAYLRAELLYGPLNTLEDNSLRPLATASCASNERACTWVGFAMDACARDESTACEIMCCCNSRYETVVRATFMRVRHGVDGQRRPSVYVARCHIARSLSISVIRLLIMIN